MTLNVNQNLCVQIFGANGQLNVIRHFANRTRQNKNHGAHSIKNVLGAYAINKINAMEKKTLNMIINDSPLKDLYRSQIKRKALGVTFAPEIYLKFFHQFEKLLISNNVNLNIKTT